MLQWILILLLIAAVASLLGFRGVAGASAGIAKILIFIVLIVMIISLMMIARFKSIVAEALLVPIDVAKKKALADAALAAATVSPAGARVRRSATSSRATPVPAPEEPLAV